MKTIILGILGLMGLVGCRSDVNSRVAEKFGETFNLKSQEEIRVGGASSDSLEVVVESIADSRCPTDVNCIWAGNAQVELTLSKDTDTQALELCIGDCHLEGEQYGAFTEQDTALVTLGAQAYEVILKAVIPYPKSTEPVGEQEAVLEINSQ